MIGAALKGDFSRKRILIEDLQLVIFHDETFKAFDPSRFVGKPEEWFAAYCHARGTLMLGRPGASSSPKIMSNILSKEAMLKHLLGIPPTTRASWICLFQAAADLMAELASLANGHFLSGGAKVLMSFHSQVNKGVLDPSAWWPEVTERPKNGRQSASV